MRPCGGRAGVTAAHRQPLCHRVCRTVPQLMQPHGHVQPQRRDAWTPRQRATQLHGGHWEQRPHLPRQGPQVSPDPAWRPRPDIVSFRPPRTQAQRGAHWGQAFASPLGCQCGRGCDGLHSFPSSCRTPSPAQLRAEGPSTVPGRRWTRSVCSWTRTSEAKQDSRDCGLPLTEAARPPGLSALWR